MRRLALLLLGSLALAGCGGGNGSSESQGSSQSSQQKTVSISEKEFSLSPSTVNVGQTGAVSFKITNDGQVAHALELEGNGVEEKTDPIQPGQSATLTVQLDKAGDYKMYCPIDGHKGKGMKGTVNVGSGSGNGGTDTGSDTTTGGGTTTDGSPGY